MLVIIFIIVLILYIGIMYNLFNKLQTNDYHSTPTRDLLNDLSNDLSNDTNDLSNDLSNDTNNSTNSSTSLRNLSD